MKMNIIVVGHTGFLGSNFTTWFLKNYPNSNITGISLEKSIKDNARITEHTSLSCTVDKEASFVFFFSHAQNAKDVVKSEKVLAQKFIHFIKDNKINCPIVVIKSIGKNSAHIKSRKGFNELLIKELSNRIIEIRATIIEEKGSLPYEIPAKIIEKLRVVPTFPWTRNKVDLIRLMDMFVIFEIILNRQCSQNILTPKARQTTYKEYIQDVAKLNGKKVRFFPVPFNDFVITPRIIHWITGIDFNIIRNLMQTLNSDAIL